MPFPTGSPAGALEFVQPRGEYLLQKAAAFAVAGLFVGLGLFVLFAARDASAGLLIGVAILGLGGLFAFLGARQQPYRMYEDGIQTPTGRFIGYGQVRDVQHIDSRSGKSKFLLLAIVDGRFAVIGSPMTKDVIFSTKEFDQVEALVVRGVQQRGFRPDMEWDPKVRDEVSALEFRGPVIVHAEKTAREQGVRWIDGGFLKRTANKRLRWWLAAAAYATSKSGLHPNRNSTPRSPRG